MKGKKKIFKNLQIGLIVAIAIGCVFFFTYRSHPDLFSSEASKEENNDQISNSDTFVFEYNTSSYTRLQLQVEPKSVAIYLNYFNDYECPYYTDRADLIAPEINRMAQMMRAFEMPIVFYTKTVEESKFDGRSEEEFVFNATTLKLDETSPLLKDICLYDDYNTKPAESNGSIHHDIKYSTTKDYFVHTHMNGVKLLKKLNVKYVIVAGMRCNLWLPPFFESLKENNIQPMYIYDLSDVAYYRGAQKKKLDTHNKALEHFWKWIANNYKATVNHFSLIDRLIPKSLRNSDIKFDGNKDAYYFIEYFEKDL